ncbi:MAG: RNA polymerase sigma factor RpoD, partial [Burkholderiales bacterium]
MTAKKSASAKIVEPELKKVSKPATKAAAPARAAAPAARPAVKAAAKAAPKAGAKPASKTAKTGPAGKAKSDSAKARGAADEDFSDIEADIAGEPEAAEDVEAKAKAKPLRMKVSRAKERALMREFGLDETALTEEEVAKRRHELKTLIKMGKTRGFLTHQ